MAKYILILIAFMYLFHSCKGQKEENTNTLTEKHNNKKGFKAQKINNQKDETFFKFQDLTIELKFNNGSSNVMINNNEYLTSLVLESANINVWYYKQDQEDKIIMIEGNDYYSSIFHIYHFYHQKLFYLGYFYVDQPNIENERPYKKDFNITSKKNKIIIETILNGAVKVRNAFTDKINEAQKL